MREPPLPGLNCSPVRAVRAAWEPQTAIREDRSVRSLFRCDRPLPVTPEQGKSRGKSIPPSGRSRSLWHFEMVGAYGLTRFRVGVDTSTSPPWATLPLHSPFLCSLCGHCVRPGFPWLLFLDTWSFQSALTTCSARDHTQSLSAGSGFYPFFPCGETEAQVEAHSQ